MSRKAKRVPETFDWPLKKVWEGYLTPEWLHEKECEPCGGTGYSKHALHIRDLWYGYAPFTPADTGSTPLGPDHPAVVEFARRNVGSAPGFYGQSETAVYAEADRLASLWDAQLSHHLTSADLAAINADYDTGATTPREYAEKSIRQILFSSSSHLYLVQKARCAEAGVKVECAVCDGHGQVEKWAGQRITADQSWRPIEPPPGDGWQMWETTSEGSPVSPVFGSAEELAGWCAEHVSLFGHAMASRERWLAIIVGDDLGEVEIAPGVIVL